MDVYGLRVARARMHVCLALHNLTRDQTYISALNYHLAHASLTMSALTPNFEAHVIMCGARKA